MSEASPGECPACGAPADGNFCSQCGTRLGGVGCGSCGARLSPGTMYCGECGTAVAPRETKPASARAPWMLSAGLLIAFSILLARLVQGGSVERIGDMTVTGGLPTVSGESGADAPGAAAPRSSGMPSMEDLGSMTPREAADRLFERAMREHEGGDFERAAFFLDMGLQAYDVVPPSDIDADARFHMGLMQLFLGDSASARRSGETILEEESDNLLGLTLAALVAGFAGDEEAAAGYRGRLDAAVEAAGGIPTRPEYESHRPLIERELEAGG